MSSLFDIRSKKTPLKLGEEVKHLHYDLNAFAELEEEHGSVETALEKLSGGSVKAIISFLRAGLLHENENLTSKDVGGMFDLSQVQEIGKLINTAIVQAMPVQQETPQPPSKKKT